MSISLDNISYKCNIKYITLVRNKGVNLLNRRIKYIRTVFISALILLFAKITWIKLMYGAEYEAAAIEQGYIDKDIPAARGRILDRNGNVLAESMPVYDVILEPKILAGCEAETVDKTITTVSSILEIPKSELYSCLQNDTYYQPIAKSVSPEKAKEIETEGLTGLWLEKKEERRYPYGTLACHVIGFKKGVNSKGIEYFYDSDLSGKAGRMVRQYENGASSVQYYEPKDGSDVVTTLDVNIQKFAEEGVKEAMDTFPCETASVLVMEPSTGEILASASSNIFDPNSPTSPMPENKEAFDSLTYAEQSEYLNKLWNSFNVSSTFEPGSIFKPMLISGALDEGIIDKNSSFYCEGFKQVEDRTIHCIRRSGHGELSLEEAISVSCNVAAMDIGEKMGRELFYKYQLAFGFGQKTGIDLPEEVSAASLMYAVNAIGPVELATCSIGQSFNCTPIQAITAFCALANGGNVMEPHIVKSIEKDGTQEYEKTPHIVRKAVSEESCELISKYLQTVVDDGTGKKASVDGYKIAGKSGTGQQGNRDEEQYTISFIGFFPADDPKAAVLVVIDKPYEYADGVTTAAPVFRNVAEKIIGYMNIPPSETVSLAGTILPDFTGKDIASAVSCAEEMGLAYKIVGTGNTVTNQFPKGGDEVTERSQIIFYT